ncbi:MAG: YicC/YloC family endoribonuclease [Desulfoferrobacter sp.]
MICSMTAFGRVQQEESGYALTVEVKTLNSRNLDIVVRIAKNYSDLEETIRKQVSQSFRRGRIEIFVQIEPTSVEQKMPDINLEIARLYWQQLQDLHAQLPASDAPKLRDLLSIPYLFDTKKEIVDRDTLKSILNGALAEVILQIVDMRTKEGGALLQDCQDRLSVLNQELSFVAQRKQEVLLEYQSRIRDRIKELLGETEVDENRLLQEVAYFAERSDINEEIVRLQSHLNQFDELLRSSEPADGRRLDFLTQELHREVNTIGSKTGDLDTIQSIVRMKGEIGKLREQVQNIE